VFDDIKQQFTDALEQGDADFFGFHFRRRSDLDHYGQPLFLPIILAQPFQRGTQAAAVQNRRT
jgi:hypothetical protein